MKRFVGRTRGTSLPPSRGGPSGHWWSRQDGAAAIEMAIVLPILVLLVFGIIQWSIAYNRSQGLHAAAREGARVGSLPSTTQSEIVSRVHDALDGVLPDPTKAAVTVTPATDRPCNLSDGRVTVKVALNHNIDIPLWGVKTVTLTGSGEFKCEAGSS